MSRDWRIYLSDMRQFCDEIGSYSVGLAKEEFERHGPLYHAIVRQLELLGEAARQVPDDVRVLAPDIEWHKLVSLRNILIHSYFGIDDDILWDIVQTRMKPLSAALQTLMGRIG